MNEIPECAIVVFFADNNLQKLPKPFSINILTLFPLIFIVPMCILPLYFFFLILTSTLVFVWTEILYHIAAYVFFFLCFVWIEFDSEQFWNDSPCHN